MSPAEPYDAADDGELPQLPIPRPGEWSPMASTRKESRIAPPVLGSPLGGGASYTAAGDDGTNDGPSPASSWTAIEREQIESERFTWELAARLTSGMLSNPARASSSVKDAMGLFDQFLQEMHAYAKIASEFDLLGTETARRRAHEEYFRHRQAGEQPASAGPVPVPVPEPPKPEPTKPRPMGDYRPIPPGARGPYAPGSMAGSPPPVDGDELAA